jgi:hypothetical protein
MLWKVLVEVVQKLETEQHRGAAHQAGSSKIQLDGKYHEELSVESFLKTESCRLQGIEFNGPTYNLHTQVNT